MEQLELLWKSEAIETNLERFEKLNIFGKQKQKGLKR